MTPLGRTVIAGLALLGAIVVSVIEHDTTIAVGVITLVLGYVFGDRNGEKRLAAALHEIDADDRRRANGT